MSIYESEYGARVIQFGSGDIEVSNGRAPDDNLTKTTYPCVTFKEWEPGVIGRKRDDYELIKNDPAEERGDINTILVFTDVRSIDVVINQLNQAKERFQKNGTKALSMQEITDEIEEKD